MTIAKKLGPPGSEIDVDAYLADCVTVSPDAIDEEFVRVPADLAYWNERFAQAHRRHLFAKLDSEREEARITLETRETVLAEWRSKITIDSKGRAAAGSAREPSIDMIRARVLADPDYRAVKIEELEAEVERARLRGLVSALEAKKDMLQSLGAKLRSEMTDPLLRASLRAG